jgi:hypothetical protein
MSGVRAVDSADTSRRGMIPAIPKTIKKHGKKHEVCLLSFRKQRMQFGKKCAWTCSPYSTRKEAWP